MAASFIYTPGKGAYHRAKAVVTVCSAKRQERQTIDCKYFSALEVIHILPDLAGPAAIDFHQREFTTEEPGEVLMVAVPQPATSRVGAAFFPKIHFGATVFLVYMVVVIPNAAEVSAAQYDVATLGWFEPS